MTNAIITGIEYYLPESILSNEELIASFPEWNVEKIYKKTGIHNRHIVKDDQCASDLAFEAAEKLFNSGISKKKDIDFILLCTQSPDYFLPTTACILQHRLGIPSSSGALDFNLGCSGYIYGLGLANGLIQTQQAKNVLLITAETYSKFIANNNRSVRTIFGDGAAATLVTASDKENKEGLIGPFIYGTDGGGAQNLIVSHGAAKYPGDFSDKLYMNGPEIFKFTLETIPPCVSDLLNMSGKVMDDVDLFVFHQANRYMLNRLRKSLEIPEEKFMIHLEESGNTVSATIPISLKHAMLEKKIKQNSLVMLVGFGVGYSWGATLVQWEI